MIKVSLGVKKKEGDVLYIDFEPVRANQPSFGFGVSKLYQSFAFDEMDGSKRRNYLGEIHFNGTKISQWIYKGSSLGNFEIRQLMRNIKKASGLFKQR